MTNGYHNNGSNLRNAYYKKERDKMPIEHPISLR